MIDEPGIYDISDAEYHADPCIEPSASCSILQLIDKKSALHAMWKHPRLHPSFESEESSKFDIGSAFHTLMMGRGRDLVPVVAKDWRTKDAQTQRDQIRANGQLPILSHKLDELQTMRQEVEIQLGEHEDFAIGGFVAEQTLVWKEGDFFFRIRPDLLAVTECYMQDFKCTETSVDPASFERHIYNMNYDFRAAFYARGFKAVTGKDLKEYKFIGCEQEEPHATAIFALTPAAMDFAAKKVDRAIGIWKDCLSKSEWPGYSKKTYYVSPPSYVEKAQIDREIAEIGA